MPNRNVEGGYPYAYQGQEKDTETGMEAFELRLWDARIGRWLTIDPYSEFSSPYLGMGNNPINGIDSDGGRFDRWELDLSTGETNWVNNDGGDTTDYVDVIAGGGDNTVLSSTSYDVQHISQVVNGPTQEGSNGGSRSSSFTDVIPGFRLTTETVFGGTGAGTDPSAELFVEYAVGLGVGKIITYGGRALRASLKYADDIPTVISRGNTNSGARRVVLQNGTTTTDITALRVKQYVKNHRNPNARYGDLVNFKKIRSS